MEFFSHSSDEKTKAEMSVVTSHTWEVAELGFSHVYWVPNHREPGSVLSAGMSPAPGRSLRNCGQEDMFSLSVVFRSLFSFQSRLFAAMASFVYL